MGVADAVHQVLSEAGQPMHFRAIAEKLVVGGIWKHSGEPCGKTPWMSVSAVLTTDRRFRGLGEGMFELADPPPPSGEGVAPPDEAGGEREETPSSEDEKSAHSCAQSALIHLGRVTGSSVWIASNDRNRMYHGETLGSGCLQALPNLGLSNEASRRISLIDIIWVRQDAPVYAFEVETSTSIYGGLLRMSDLLALLPTLNIGLYVVAPKDRQKKVMAELGRPTFRGIGLGKHCQFIPVEGLLSLLETVGNLPGGSVQPVILSAVAVSLDGDAGSSPA